MAYLDDQTKRINSMYDTLKKQKASELTNQRNTAINELNRQLNEQLPQYQTQRAQADVSQTQNLNKLREYMANMGAFNSGDNFSRASNLLSQRNNSVNQINGNENTFRVGINNGITDARNTYNTNLNSSNTAIDAQRMQDLIALQNQMHQEQLAAAQAAAARRSSGGGSRRSSSGGSYVGGMTDAEMLKAANQQLKYRYNDGNAEQWLRQNEDELRNDLGNDWFDQNLRKAVQQRYNQNVTRANAGQRVAEDGGGRALMNY